ncbi:hypothetical protein LOKVESSMR4R_00083 [Yoonia vestfoldensis]|uniref:Uncharacterized protein n=1 Tax=Yoonia vestfoldensis TaxID=245188 RepID=A0A1Y0E7P5_9RHOB|nr:hypothetical protein LOKVESSMR4R_00083 [Yoonia vestfoldensis]
MQKASTWLLVNDVISQCQVRLQTLKLVKGVLSLFRGAVPKRPTCKVPK